MSLVAVSDYPRLIANELQIEFFRGTLSQLKTPNPIVYSDPGCIQQDKNGKLRLKLYHSYSEDAEMDLSDLLQFKGNLPFGKIIADEHYFSFEATDMQGLLWRAEKVWLEGNLSLPANGRIVEAEIQSLKTTKQRIENKEQLRAYGYAVIPGTFQLPSQITEWNASGEKFKKSELLLEDKPCTILRYEKRLEISFEIPDLVSAEEYSSRLLQAVSFSIGAFLHPILKGNSDRNGLFQVIKSRRRDIEAARIPPPIQVTYPHHFSQLQSLVNAFLRREPLPFSKFFGYWYRVLISADGDAENQALVLSTAIEGVIKHYFEAYRSTDDDYIDQVDSAIAVIDALDIGTRAKDSAIKSLRGSKGSSTKNALHKLAAVGLITGDLLKTWQHLRNKSAHADGLRMDNSEIQLLIDEIHSCLELFYRLILSHLGYTDSFVRYSACGVGAGELPVAQLPKDGA